MKAAVGESLEKETREECRHDRENALGSCMVRTPSVVIVVLVAATAKGKETKDDLVGAGIAWMTELD